MSLTLRKKTLHQNFKVMSLQYVKKSNNYLSQSNIDKIIDILSKWFVSIMLFFIFDLLI